MRANLHKSIAVLGLMATSASIAIAAQPAPDAGQLRQQIDREREATLPGRSTQQIAPSPAPMKPEQGVSVTVRSFQFSGNTLIASSVLESAVSAYLNRPLSFAELQNAAADVAEAYRKAGWIVRTYLPQQDIQDGVVTIQIVEAVFGSIRPEGNPPTRLKLERAIGMLESAQAKGEPVNSDKLDRALLLLDDLPGVAASASLQAGQGEGETDLVLKLADEPLLTGEVNADNTAPRATGNERVTANAYLNSPFKIGDQLTANVIHSRGNDYLRLAYTLPVGNDGWRVGVSGDVLHYDIVSPEFRAANMSGDSSSLGLNASYPIIRSRLKNLFVGFNYDRKYFDNEANHITSTHYRIQNFSASLNGNLFDKIGGGGANSAGLTLTRGNVDLGTLDFSENANLDGNFTKLNYNLSRQQVITDQWSFFAAIYGQESNTRVDSAENLYLGGANGVRAYPANEAGGPDGQIVNLEVRWRLPNNLTMTGFYDIGHVSDTGIANQDSVTLKGAGLAASWTAGFGLNLKATWAHRIGDNPLKDATTGNDTDGSHRENRFWLSATMPF